MNSTQKHFDKLVSQALEGTIKTKEFEDLRAMLSDNESLQRRYFSFVRNESILHWEQTTLEQNDPEKLISFPWIHQVASLAAVIVCLISAWLIHSNFSKALDVNSHDFSSNPDDTNEPSIVIASRTLTSDRDSDSIHLVSNEAVKVASFISSLRSNDPLIEGGELLHDGTFKYVRADDYLSTSAISGVLPMKDGQMIQFSDMEIDEVNRIAEVSETMRVYELEGHTFSPNNVVDASVHFNESFSALSDTTEFSLSLHAIDGNEKGDYVEVSASEQILLGDNDQTTWEKADTFLTIPDGADYLVVSLRARKHGADAFSTNHNQLFADELEISFTGI